MTAVQSAPLHADGRRPPLKGSEGDRLLTRSHGGSASYPVGSYPILLVAWFATAVLERQISVQLVSRNSLKQFKQAFGIEADPNESYTVLTTIVTQQRRLLNSRFRLVDGRICLSGDGSNDLEALGISKVSTPSESTAEPTSIELSDWFIKECSKEIIDLNSHCLWVLKGDRLALELYIWFRCRAADGLDTGTVKWERLNAELGAQARSIELFRDRVTRALSNVVVICPNVVAAPTNAGLVYTLASSFRVGAR